MSRSFSAAELRQIRAALQQTGERLFARYGVAKTTIDDLVKGAGIAKGSFYRFYQSKEALFFELLEKRQDKLRAPLLEDANKTRAAFETIIEHLLRASGSDPLVRLMGQQDDLQAVMRRVPPETLQRHQQEDQAFLEEVIARWSQRRDKNQRDDFAARLTAGLLVSLHREFVGERLFGYAMKAAAESIADCLFNGGAKS